MSKEFMDDKVTHIGAVDDDGKYIVPLESKKGNCFATWSLPRKGDKIQIDDRDGEWEVIDVIHTLCTGPIEPVTLRLKQASLELGEGAPA